jgi:hypothetical protein
MFEGDIRGKIKKELRALSQLQWPESDRAVWFSLRENHENAYSSSSSAKIALDPCNLRLGLRAAGRRQASVETQHIEKRLQTHVAQHHTECEGGDRRAKHHQHTDIDSHKRPFKPEFFAHPFVRRSRTLIHFRDDVGSVSVPFTSVSLLQTAALR